MVTRSAIPKVAALVLTAVGAAPAALAQAAGEAAPEAGRWSFALTPYAWFISLEGDVATFKGAPPANVDADFKDIIDHTNGAVLLTGEARHGSFGVVFDLNYLDISAKGDTPGQLFGDAEMDSHTLFSDVAGFREVYADERVRLDLTAGARLWYVETEVDLRAGLAQARTDEASKVWVDPIVGLRGRAELGSGFFLAGEADYGGFHVGSDKSWEVLGTLGYAFSDRLSARAGYRYLSVDYEDDGFVWDVDIQGPIVGVTWRF